ncbi:MAG: 4Fe-4S dicluster domain-containing protein [Chloroflexi bacterium]|nr:MAG: 4Fe-4S dicluster domain-containing protein [Chloroflexota bacterium]
MTAGDTVGILTDITRCVGCYQCVDACAQVHNLGPDIPAPQDLPDGLSARRWTTILEQPANHYVRKQCRHCLNPACVSVCPVGAMQKTALGPVIYDSSKCLGCRYCMMACPYGIPRYQWDSLAPVVRKCTLCYERLQAGKLPACVEACPQQATIFGLRDDLLAEAHRRLQAEPAKYVQKVYGEHEVGGTSVLYISDVPLDFLGYRGYPGQKPLPELTEVVMSKIPAVAIGMTVLTAGIHWIISRRMKIAARTALVDTLPSKTAEDQDEIY